MRHWLSVTTGEVQAKTGVNERLAKRRACLAERAAALRATVIEPVLQDGAKARPGFELRDDGADDWSVLRLGLYETALATHDPRAAFYRVEVDAYQPLVIVRRKASGAAADIDARTAHADSLDRARLETLLFGDFEPARE